jgi:hypothetical protein
VIAPRRWTQLGTLLVALALLGFLTVADELRHLGEFAAVLGLLLAGLACLLAGRFPAWATHGALQWVPVGIALGMGLGLAADREPLGVALGTLLGLALARARRTRQDRFTPPTP